MVPGDRQLDVKAAAKAFSVKRLQMAAPAAAERLTGCRVGGISPFGIPRTLPVMIDQRVESYDRIAVNGGRRGLMLLMTPQDAARAARAKWSALSAG
jgi:Cys-tRNA(Pro)/Cys-tRNA(Cys) deacylase